jgi:hypothetical protein
MKMHQMVIKNGVIVRGVFLLILLFLTTHVSQGSTYDCPYNIYGYQCFDQPLIYTNMSRSTKKSCINLVDYKPSK